jgi:hypothetical protein
MVRYQIEGIFSVNQESYQLKAPHAHGAFSFSEEIKKRLKWTG